MLIIFILHDFFYIFGLSISVVFQMCVSDILISALSFHFLFPSLQLGLVVRGSPLIVVVFYVLYLFVSKSTRLRM